MKLSKVFKDGIFSNNPVFIQLIGLCSVLGVSSAVMNSLAMGLALTFVLTGSNIVISLLRSVIPDKIRIPCYVVIIAISTDSSQAIKEPFCATIAWLLTSTAINCPGKLIEKTISLWLEYAHYEQGFHVLTGSDTLFHNGWDSGYRDI